METFSGALGSPCDAIECLGELILGSGRSLTFPGRDKKFFYIFDFCQNLDFFSHDSEATEGSAGDSLSKRIFCHRVDLIAAVDKLEYGSDSGLRITRQSLVDGLRNEIAGMSLE